MKQPPPGLVQGFTLIELLVTLAIVALLGVLATPVAEVAAQRAQEAELRRNLRLLRDAIDTYKRDWDAGRIARQVGESGYPPNLQILVDGVIDVRDPVKRKRYYLRFIPPDPMQVSGGATVWLTRSYQSPAAQPAPGLDVFDVFSTSTAIGLDGRAYRDW